MGVTHHEVAPKPRREAKGYVLNKGLGRFETSVEGHRFKQSRNRSRKSGDRLHLPHREFWAGIVEMVKDNYNELTQEHKSLTV